MRKLADLRKVILAVWGVTVAAMLIIYLILGENESKATYGIVSILVPLIFYGIMLIDFKIAGKDSRGFIKFVSWFFFFGGCVGMIMFISRFAKDFPNGYTPLGSISLGIVMSILEYNSKLNKTN